MLPLPSWPLVPSPQQSTPPESRTAQVLPSWALARLRTLTWALPGPKAATGLGVWLKPAEVEPQQSTRPPVSRAQMFGPWPLSPVTRAVTPLRVPLPPGPVTLTGRLLLTPVTDGLPSTPPPLDPQQSAPPVVRMAQLVRPGTPVTPLTLGSFPV